MSRFSELLNVAEGNTKHVPVSTMNDEAILNHIMVTLCEVLDTSKMAFKGGYVLYNIIENGTARATADIDFSIQVKEYYEDVKVALINIGNSLLAVNEILRYEVKESIQETMTGGIEVYRSDNGQERKLGVDVGLHDISYGTIPVTIHGMNINIFSPERMLGDKISAMHTRRRFRRPKDLYDFYLITNSFNVDMRELNRMIKIRGGLPVPETLYNDAILDEWFKAYSKLTIKKDIRDKEGRPDVVKPEFNDIISRLSLFINNLEFNLIWDNKVREFMEC